MPKYFRTLAIALVVTSIWGYFADLRHDQIGWFVGRLLFVSGLVLAYSLLIQRRAAKANPEAGR